ncbi:NAD dependent epimerase/dehydratase family protein [Westerdykella ornata]|uniref:NAD dependent epimerase/dehydratase family protein n=1 Tax=Westerdykella ornata TaxID=318751 RepID=A0A6A6JGU1_WESOR|nr:NAD dependent epimerase/dehydratase family protein [Westerdykella ornata]KAF2275188.1 NAD dependent epimerase/dehydratase family protein [Westerdykella ornata]
MTKLFITGATGYIGGDVLYAIAHAFPDLEITALVRNSDKGAKVAAQYPKIRLVYGDLDSTDVITKASAEADVVVNTANVDHEASARAIVAGLAQKKEGEKGWLIHTSGTGILCYADYERKSYGAKNEKVFDDWDGIGEVLNIPDAALHRPVDKIVLAASHQYPGKISTAIICPPTIYGPGRGPDRTKSIQANLMARATLVRKKGFHVEGGENKWTQVHIQDLSNVYISLLTEALTAGGGKATWNDEGYYFAEAGEFVWGDLAKEIAKAAKDKGYIETSEVDAISTEEADKLVELGSYLWGVNSRCRSIRANKLFGWKPTQKSLFDLVPEIVDVEARDLGITKGHAAKAAGAV